MQLPENPVFWIVELHFAAAQDAVRSGITAAAACIRQHFPSHGVARELHKWFSMFFFALLWSQSSGALAANFPVEVSWETWWWPTEPQGSRTRELLKLMQNGEKAARIRSHSSTIKVHSVQQAARDRLDGKPVFGAVIDVAFRQHLWRIFFVGELCPAVPSGPD